MLVVVPSAELAERVSDGLAADVLVVGKSSLEGTILEALREGRKVAALYPGAWMDYNGIVSRASSEGLNWLLYTPLDTLEFDLAYPALKPRWLVAAKIAMHAVSPADRAPTRVLAGKTVSRRALLFNPLRALTDFTPGPVLLNPDLCVMQKACRLCIEACPTGALRGKPPTLAHDACTSCGECVGACPFGLLSMPKISLDGFEYFTKIILEHSQSPLYLIVACRSSLAELAETLKDRARIVGPAVVIDVECPSWVGEAHLLLASLAGLHTIYYCDEAHTAICMQNRPHTIPGLPVESLTPGRPEELISILSKPPRSRKAGNSLEINGARGPSLAHMAAILYHLRQVETLEPLAGMVEVDANACTLCGACTAVCPFGALSIDVDRQARRVRLTFRHDLCRGCGFCVEACPHDAMSVRRILNPAAWGRVTIVAEDELASCTRCGAPIASASALRRVEEELKRQGVPSRVVERIRLCPRCRAAIPQH